MPYRKKASAPFVINLGQEFGAIIFGTEAGWLGGYIPFLGLDYEDVTQMCLKGPPKDADWTASDALLVASGIGNILLVNKLRRVAIKEVFATFCEVVPGVENWVPIVGPVRATAPFQMFDIPLPAGATHIRSTFSNPFVHDFGCGDPGVPCGWQSRVVLWDDLAHNGRIDLNNTGFNRITPPFGTEASGSVVVPASSHYLTVMLVGDQGSTPSADILVELDLPVNPVRPLAPQPPNTLTPPTTTGSVDVPGLAVDLAHIESQIESVQSLVKELAAQTGVSAVVRPDLAVTVGNDGIVDLGNVGGVSIDAVGILLTVTGVPAWVGSTVAEPTRLVKLGTLTLGRPEGWFQSFTIEHAQTVVIPLPIGAKRVGVKLVPGASGVVTPLLSS